MNVAAELRAALRPLLQEWAERAAAEAVQAHKKELELLRESVAVRSHREA